VVPAGAVTPPFPSLRVIGVKDVVAKTDAGSCSNTLTQR